MKPGRRAPARRALWPALRWQLKLSAPPDADGVVRVRASQRIFVVAGAIGLGYLALLTQASSLMLLPDAQLEAKASEQFESAIEISGRRGDILDRNGTQLATSVDLTEVRADPARLDPTVIPSLSAALAPLLGATVEDVTAKLSQSSRQDVLLGRGFTPEQAAAMRKISPHEGIFFVADPQRYYPGRADAATLLGVVGRNGVGLAGVEQSLDGYLRGQTWRYVQWRDRKGRQIEVKAPPVQPGNTVVLTIDRQIQRTVEAVIDEGWERMKPQTLHAVVLDVKTGEILALANRPTQNPNDTTDLDMNAFKDHVVMDAFEPGSVFKPFIAAAALEEGVVTPDTKIDCEGGSWVVANKVIHDDHPHGVVTVSEVIKYSSNIGAAKIAFKLGATRTIDYLTKFGFGRATGLGLPGETRGVLRSADNIKEIELATTAYGHGVSTSTIQLAVAVGALANGGVRMKPHLVKEIRDAHGEVIRHTDPEEDNRVVSAESARKTLAMMEEVTEQGGTGTRGRVPGYQVAGKTGTAWKHIDGGGYSATQRVGSFVGTLPVSDPRVVIVVVVDSPSEGSRYGGLTAGPVFAEIGTNVMRLLGVPPDPVLLAEDSKPAKTPTVTGSPDVVPPAPHTSNELVWLDASSLRTPDLKGLSLRDALATLQGVGLQFSIQGSGRVSMQTPAPGMPITPGAPVAVVLQ